MAQRHSSSEGTIYQLPSGHWRAQVCVDRRRLSTTRRTKVEAREWIREMQTQVGQGMTYQAAQTRLDEFLNGWLETKRNHIRPATYRQYSDSANIYILPQLGELKLIDLTPGKVQAFIDKMMQDQVGRRTAQIVRVVLHSCLKHAQQIGLIGRNPAALVMVPKPVKHEMSIWTESQVSQFLVAIRGERNEYLYHLALTTGMRQGELLGLKWEDIDWRRGTIQVKRQAVEIRGGGYGYQEPKSERGRRSVELGIGMVEKLRGQLGRVDLARNIARTAWRENDLVFPSLRGTPQLGTNLDRDFKQLVGKAGLPRIRFHDLRHTAASIMLSHGIPPVIVSGIMGHSLNVLMDNYAHFIPSSQGEAARLMDELTTPIKVSIERK